MGKNMKLQDVLPSWLVTRKGEPVPYGDRVRPRKVGRYFRKCLGIYGDLSHGIYGDFFNDECSNEVIKDSLKDGKLFNLLWSSGEEYIFIAGEKILEIVRPAKIWGHLWLLKKTFGCLFSTYPQRRS